MIGLASWAITLDTPGTWAIFLFQCKTGVTGVAKKCRLSRMLPLLSSTVQAHPWKDRLIISSQSHHPGQIYSVGSMGAPGLYGLVNYRAACARGRLGCKSCVIACKLETNSIFP